MPTTGVLYFVIGDPRGRYLNKAVLSVTSLKRHMPWIKAVLFTDTDREIDKHFDQVIHTEPPRKKDIWLYKYRCFLQSPFEHTLHMDADTYICDDFSEVFEMLDQFDFVTCLSPQYYDVNDKTEDVPSCFPEVAGGFMLWKRNQVTTKLWNSMLELLPYRSWRRADEPALRKAMYWSPVRYAILPWEYTCVFSMPGYLMGKVKVMHGRRKTIVRDAEIFNKVADKRVYSGANLFRLKSAKGKYMALDEVVKYGWETKR